MLQVSASRGVVHDALWWTLAAVVIWHILNQPPAPRLSICAHARVCEPRARVTAGVINPDSPIAQRYLSIPHISLGRGGAMRKFGEF